jgi:hypothetical protein
MFTVMADFFVEAIIIYTANFHTQHEQWNTPEHSALFWGRLLLDTALADKLYT